MRILLSGIYDGYERVVQTHEVGDGSLWWNFFNRGLDAEAGFYSLLMTLGVYASAISIVVSAIMLIIEAGGNSQKLTEAKNNIIKVIIVSILIFAVCGFVNMISSVGMDYYK